MNLFLSFQFLSWLLVRLGFWLDFTCCYWNLLISKSKHWVFFVREILFSSSYVQVIYRNFKSIFFFILVSIFLWKKEPNFNSTGYLLQGLLGRKLLQQKVKIFWDILCKSTILSLLSVLGLFLNIVERCLDVVNFFWLYLILCYWNF